MDDFPDHLADDALVNHQQESPGRDVEVKPSECAMDVAKAMFAHFDFASAANPRRNALYSSGVE